MVPVGSWLWRGSQTRSCYDPSTPQLGVGGAQGSAVSEGHASVGERGRTCKTDQVSVLAAMTTNRRNAATVFASSLEKKRHDS